MSKKQSAAAWRRLGVRSASTDQWGQIGTPTQFCAMDEALACARRALDGHVQRLGKHGVRLLRCDPVLTSERFKALCCLQQRDTEEDGVMANAALLTFHGAPLPATLSGIVQHGYLAAGDVVPDTGDELDMSHGNVHGDGVYSSTNPAFSRWYSFVDAQGRLELLCNLVVPGRCSAVFSNDDDRGDHGNDTSRSTSRKTATTLVPQTMRLDSGADVCHQIVVSHETERIVPAFRVTLAFASDYLPARKNALSVSTVRPGRHELAEAPVVRFLALPGDPLAAAAGSNGHRRQRQQPEPLFVVTHGVAAAPPDQGTGEEETTPKTKEEKGGDHVAVVAPHSFFASSAPFCRALQRLASAEDLAQSVTAYATKSVHASGGGGSGVALPPFSHHAHTHHHHRIVVPDQDVFGTTEAAVACAVRDLLAKDLRDAGRRAGATSTTGRRNVLVVFVSDIANRAEAKAFDPATADETLRETLDRVVLSGGLSADPDRWRVCLVRTAATGAPAGGSSSFPSPLLRAPDVPTEDEMSAEVNAALANRKRKGTHVVAASRTSACQRAQMTLHGLKSALDRSVPEPDEEWMYDLVSSGGDAADWLESVLSQRLLQRFARRRRLQNREDDAQSRQILPRLRVPFPHGLCGEGFVRDLCAGPVWDAGDLPLPALFLGKPPPFLRFGSGSPARVEEVKAPENDEKENETAPLPLLQAIVRLATQALVRFRSAATLRPDLHHALVPFVDRVCSAALVAARDFVPRSSSTAAVDRMERLRTARQMLAGLENQVAQIRCWAGVPLRGAWLGQLERMRFGRDVARRAGLTQTQTQTQPSSHSPQALFDRLHAEHPDLFRRSRWTPEEIGDALCTCDGEDARGPVVRLRRTGASEVEPWLTHVEAVDPFRTTTVAEAFLEATTATNVVVPLLLFPDAMPEAPTLRRMAVAWALTGSPFAIMPSQGPALLVSAWVALADQIWGACRRVVAPPGPSSSSSSRGSRDGGVCRTVSQEQREAEARELACKRLAVWREWTTRRVAVAVREGRVLPQGWRQRAATVGTDDADAQLLLTDGEGVLSVNMALAVMAEDGVFASKRLVFGLLAEAVARAARAELKLTTRACDPSERLRRVLCLDLVPEDDGSDSRSPLVPDDWVERTAARTASFYRRRFVTPSPTGVCAVVALLSRLAAGDTDEQIADRLLSPDGGGTTMRSFFERFSEAGGEGGQPQVPRRLLVATQAALYVEGLARRGHARPEGYGDPVAVLQTRLGELLRQRQARQAAREAAEDRVKARRLRQLARALPTRDRHTHPRMFTWQEVERLNLERPTDDQLELDPDTGLLVHHCCYPNCPDFLRSFRDPSAPRKFRRRGLFNHFRLDRTLLDNCEPAFHRFGVGWLRTRARRLRRKATNNGHDNHVVEEEEDDFRAFASAMAERFPAVFFARSKTKFGLSSTGAEAVRDLWSQRHKIE